MISQRLSTVSGVVSLCIPGGGSRRCFRVGFKSLTFEISARQSRHTVCRLGQSDLSFAQIAGCVSLTVNSQAGSHMAREDKGGLRNLVIVFGDQLNEDLNGFHKFDIRSDAVLMMEVGEEATYRRTTFNAS